VQEEPKKQDDTSSESTSVTIGKETVSADEISAFGSVVMSEAPDLSSAMAAAGLDETEVSFPDSIVIGSSSLMPSSYSATRGVVRVVYSSDNGNTVSLERGNYKGISIWAGLMYELSWDMDVNGKTVKCFGNNYDTPLAAEWPDAKGIRAYVQVLNPVDTLSFSTEELSNVVLSV
jgi:hypothetical protein